MTEWDGARYAEVSALQRSMADQSLAGLVFVGTERVLDIGCGDGFVTAQIAARVPEGGVVGVDVSQYMLEQALRTAGDLAFFLRADACALPFVTAFDVVVSFNALHWVLDQRKALGAVASVVRPGGRAVIQVVGAGERPSVEAVAMDVAHSVRWRKYFTGFVAPFVHVTDAQFADNATAAGFDVTSAVTTEREWDFGSRERFAAWCGVGTGAWTDRIGSDTQPFVDDLVDAYEAVAGRPGLFRFTQLRAELQRR